MVSVPAFRALRERGVDVEHVLEAGLGGGTDRDVLAYARRSNRIVVTRNYRDYVPLARALASRDVSFPGILFLPSSLQQDDVGGHVCRIESWIERHGSRAHPVRNGYRWA